MRSSLALVVARFRLQLPRPSPSSLQQLAAAPEAYATTPAAAVVRSPSFSAQLCIRVRRLDKGRGRSTGVRRDAESCRQQRPRPPRPVHAPCSVPCSVPGRQAIACRRNSALVGLAWFHGVLCAPSAPNDGASGARRPRQLVRTESCAPESDGAKDGARPVTPPPSHRFISDHILLFFANPG